ncbi:hypothetical protein THITH_12675 [Thioalkalivibrio paradoxus ARh 1]|uniref:Uncharacterized protein n=1 Tax=Thioalkalivibrio paradoxus ARh 1 TaxID=713585 RepID=W0DP47_9GAMM|nr:hypothetical protein THITH_12675 [Thioalkalivibrio paradoxus ARh 1]
MNGVHRRVTEAAFAAIRREQQHCARVSRPKRNAPHDTSEDVDEPTMAERRDNVCADAKPALVVDA